jgi:hypothetical protein
MAQDLKTKSTPKFSTIQAIWRTIGAISRVIRDNSRAIQEQFETIGAMAYAIVKSRPSYQNLSAIRGKDLSACGGYECGTKVAAV